MDTWTCPGCGDTLTDPKTVRHHPDDCEWVDGAGSALPLRSYAVSFTVDVEAASPEHAAAIARDDMKDLLRHQVMLEVQPVDAAETGEDSVEIIT